MNPYKTILETPHYRLRFPNESDIDFIFSATRYPGFNDGMPWEPPKDKAELYAPLNRNMEKWTSGKAYNFTVESRGEPALRLGRIEIREGEVENLWTIGYWTHPAHQGKGIMTEAVQAILKFGFINLKATEIRASYVMRNKGSEKVLVNNGFRFIQHIEKGFQKKGIWLAENEFGINKAIWETSSNTTANNYFSAILKDNKNTVFENERLLVLLDIDPISLGHVIICPREHYPDFHDLPGELLKQMMLLAQQYVKILQKIFQPKGYSLMLNGGAFNDIKHCHLHVFPRNSKEEFQWTYDESLLSKDAKRFDVLKTLLESYF